MIVIYLFAFIFIIIGALIRMNSDIGEGVFDGGDDIFFGIKDIWGYIHLALYTVLGYVGGIELFPLALLVSIVWEASETLLAHVSDDIINGNGALDTLIDMSGYLLGSYLNYRFK
tara:strand:- start:168 stop:512 length:345 start_codon:yes stop_codon:yes gene_type:complete